MLATKTVTPAPFSSVLRTRMSLHIGTKRGYFSTSATSLNMSAAAWRTRRLVVNCGIQGQPVGAGGSGDPVLETSAAIMAPDFRSRGNERRLNRRQRLIMSRAPLAAAKNPRQIGRASCREREQVSSV